MPTPTVRRLRLGHELRRLRERAGIDVADAAKMIERSQPNMSRLELGQSTIKQRDLRELIEYYEERIGRCSNGDPIDGDDDWDLDYLIKLNEGARERGRWSGPRSTYANYFRQAVDLESDAEKINVYEMAAIYGLLQTEDYTRGLSWSLRYSDDHTRSVLSARRERKENLQKENPPQINALFHESAFRRVVGGREVMHEQIKHLQEMAQFPTVHLYVLPFDAQTEVPVGHQFTYFRVPSLSPHSPALEFVYAERYRGADYYDDNTKLAEYGDLWDGLLGAALDPHRSFDFLGDMAREFQ